jgi:hypothetical protein
MAELISCSGCGWKVTSTASVCPKCGRKNPGKEKKKTGCFTMGCAVVAAVLVIGAIILALLPTPTAHGPHIPVAGENVILATPSGKGLVWIAREDAWDEVNTALDAHNSDYLAVLGAQGKLRAVPSGTKAILTKNSIGSVKVIAEGFEGWTSREYVHVLAK